MINSISSAVIQGRAETFGRASTMTKALYRAVLKTSIWQYIVTYSLLICILVLDAINAVLTKKNKTDKTLQV